MDFYNKNFYQLIRHLDPSGMLNVPVLVFTDKKYLDEYFSTNKDFQKLDVPWMCDKLVTLLTNFDDVIFPTTQLIQNDFQYKKYMFFFISQAFIGLILIHEQSIKAYYNYCRTSTISVYKTKIAKTRVPKKKKTEKSDDQPYRNLFIENQNINQFNQNQVILTDKVINESDVILESNNKPILLNQNTIFNLNDKENLDGHPRFDLELPNLPLQPIGEFTIINPNMPINYPHFSNESEKLKGINVIQPNHMEFQESGKQSQNTNRLQNQKIETNKLTEQFKSELNQKEQHKQISTENDSPQNNLNNQSCKRKRLSKSMKGNYKKKPIEQSSKLRKHGLKTLEGQLFDRPLERMEMKYFYQSMNHLPLRYATYRSKLNIPFAVLTLNMELEINKNQNDIFNNEMTKGSYKAICEKLNYNTTTNSCIYQQCLNNELPHLSLLLLAEECIINNSLVWRNTINEINKKLEDSLKDFQNSNTDQTKWDEFKEKMKLRVNQSLVAHKTLIGYEQSHMDVQHPILDFPSLCQIQVPETQSLITELGLLPSGNSPGNIQHPNIYKDNYGLNIINLDGSLNNRNVVQPVENCHEQSVDIISIISHILQQSSENTSYLIFTDLCPMHLTKRKHASLVFRKLLGLHQKRIVVLNQSHNIIDPSSISIQLNFNSFL